MQLSTVVYHILLMRLPMETSDILRKISGHVVFAESQSGAFRTVIPQSILRIMHYAILQIINIRTLLIADRMGLLGRVAGTGGTKIRRHDGTADGTAETN